MSLNWNLANVKNSDTVCWKDGKMSHTTHLIIWLTMAVDIGEITSKNVEEFVARTMLLDDLYASSCKDGPMSITLEEATAHIGLQTNVVTLSRKRFLARIAKRLAARMCDYETRIKHQKGGAA